jgi:hypothetical protein
MKCIIFFLLSFFFISGDETHVDHRLLGHPNFALLRSLLQNQVRTHSIKTEGVWMSKKKIWRNHFVEVLMKNTHGELERQKSFSIPNLIYPDLIYSDLINPDLIYPDLIYPELVYTWPNQPWPYLPWLNITPNHPQSVLHPLAFPSQLLWFMTKWLFSNKDQPRC